MSVSNACGGREREGEGKLLQAVRERPKQRGCLPVEREGGGWNAEMEERAVRAQVGSFLLSYCTERTEAAKRMFRFLES